MKFEPIPHRTFLFLQGPPGEFFWRLAEQLRDHALTVVLHCGGGSFKSQMKRADASRARYAVIVGDDEARAGMVSVKALRELTAQAQVSLEEAVDLIRKDKRR